jgi:hypothetical protein
MNQVPTKPRAVQRGTSVRASRAPSGYSAGSVGLKVARPDMGGSVEAAPIHGQNTQTLVLHCADDTVRVVIKPNSGASGWDVDAQSQLTGI